jgi:hypothetical protein
MLLRPRFILLIPIIILAVIITSCEFPGSTQIPADNTANPEAEVIIPAVTATQASLAAPEPTPQGISTPISVGPNQSDFPAGYNPLTGKPTEDESTLYLPAMLLSISNFPPVARPQAGLSFADFVYEFTITAGENRFLGVFYGDFPHVEIPPTGGCEVRRGSFIKTGTLIGNWVWHDINRNGIQDIGERGIGGVCVKLLDGSGDMLQETTTDTNGYYGFNVEPGKYTIEIVKPDGWGFTESNLGNDDQDSDVDQDSGQMDAVISSDDLFLDAGLIPLSQDLLTPDASVKPPRAQVGPIRSGRIFYSYFASMYQNSCLVYASASEEVLDKIPHCAMVAHEFAGGGDMMSLDRFIAVANDNGKSNNFNYASNLFSDVPPRGGALASQINIFWANLNQAAWMYDPLYGAYLRFVDNSDKKTLGVLHPDTDRLTGRQLYFENFIVLFADHTAISPTIIDIDVNIGASGNALLFRDGQKYNIKWSTKGGAYEKQTGKRRPIQFLNADGTPAALKPGHTWVMMVTPFSLVEEKSPGTWRIRYYRVRGESSGAD